MQITEVSRISQLSDKGAETFDRILSNYGVSVDMIADLFVKTIKGLPDTILNPAASWYTHANHFAAMLAQKYSTTVEIATAVIAAVSPREFWEGNKRIAETVLSRRDELITLSPEDAATEIGMTLKSNVVMAVKLSRGESIDETLTGTKRRSFYNNIVSPIDGDSVTIDTWMLRAFMSLSGCTLTQANIFLRASRFVTGDTGVGYIAIAEAVRKASKSLGIYPQQTQALYWVATRGSAN